MAKDLTIKFFPDRRTTIVPKPDGGVRGPTYGVKIRSSIRQLCRMADIRMVLLQQRDFCNAMWTHGMIVDRSVAGFACLEFSYCYINSTNLRETRQIYTDYICLHEISHILLQIEDEKETDRGAILMAEQLGIKLPIRLNDKDEIEGLTLANEWVVVNCPSLKEGACRIHSYNFSEFDEDACA